MRRALVLLACVGAACCLVAPGVAAQPQPAAHPLIGIADENVTMFSDPRFLALGIEDVRLYVSWDVLSSRYHSSYGRFILGAWLSRARADGLTPLITFDRSARRGHGGQLPSVAQFSRAFLAFHKLYPWVTEFATWNEANYYGEPTARSPRRAARYYLALRRDCPTCTILAPELLDLRSPRQAVPMVRWARAFIRAAHTQPGYWGLHDYASANVLSDASTRRLLRVIRGKIWLTETGGIIAMPHHGKVGFPLTAAHAARVDAYILHDVTRLSPRIQRVYLYQWQMPTPHASWDTAVIAYDGVPRPAYDVIASTLAGWGVAPDCAVSTLPPACRAGAGSTGATAVTGASGERQGGGDRPRPPGPDGA
ncbi:MAG TPA: hypothetical protein VL977_03195 [Solirubrobacteraceae bacterium]|nr:hypothetical protein [Solirubrobacteraceae bacterium]